MPGFLLPLAGYGLAATGIGTGLTAAGIKLGQAIPGLGLDKESVARGEVVDLSEINEDGKVNKIEDYSFFDRFRDGVLGYSEADLAETRAQQKRKSIQKANSADTSEIASYREGLGLDPAGIQKMRPGETEAMYKNRIQREAQIVDAAQTYENNPNPNKLPLTSFGGKPSLAQLRTANTTATNTDPYGTRGTSIYNRTEERRIRDQARMDRLEDLLREQRNRTADRQDQRDLNRMQFDLQNRRLDMQEARNYRLDRQKAIMQIVQGFNQMGQAFAY